MEGIERYKAIVPHWQEWIDPDIWLNTESWNDLPAQSVQVSDHDLEIDSERSEKSILADKPQKPKHYHRRTRISEDAQPVEADLEAASTAGLDSRQISEEWGRFRDHHRAKGSVMADWSAAWRTWIANSRRFRPVTGPPLRQAHAPRRLPVSGPMKTAIIKNSETALWKIT